MPIIKRADGVRFVSQSYREQLVATKFSLVKKGIRTLAKQHGENVCIFRQNKGPFEVVFSRESGFLLGEAIWHNFGRPNNLIYCEALHESEQALLIIVRSGSVYLDAKLSFADVINELISLSTTNEKYFIYVYGEVPLAEEKAENKFAFNVNQVNSFTRLKESVFSKLRPDDTLQLQPLELALASPLLKVQVSKNLMFVLFIVILVLAGWYIFSITKKVEPERSIASPIIIAADPYAEYDKALSTPRPDLIMRELIRVIILFVGLPGWQASSVTYIDRQYLIKLQPIDGGKIEDLTDWAARRNLEIKQQDGAVSFTINSQLSDRKKPDFVYNLTALQKVFYNLLSPVVTKENIRVIESNYSGKIKHLVMDIDLKDFAPDLLRQLGQVLVKFPVEINTIEISNLQGLFSGKVKLTIWGS